MNQNTYSIYKFTFSDGKTYIGQTSMPVKQRWSNGEGYRNQKVYEPIKAEGWNNIKKEILETNLTLEQANELEKYYIQYFNSIENGYNQDRGGNNSASLQKTVLIDCTRHNPKGNYFLMDQDMYFLASSRLKPCGLTVYMYLKAQVPDTYNIAEKNSNNGRIRPFALSPAAIDEATYSKKRTAEEGIKDLIQKGYLIQKRGNLYQFIDILPEDRPQTLEEHQIVQSYAEIIEESIEERNKERDEQLKNIASQHISGIKNAYHDSWMGDDEYWVEDEPRSRRITIQEQMSNQFNFIDINNVADWARVPEKLRQLKRK